MLESVGEECCREVLWISVVVEVLEKSVVERCCGEVLWLKCWRRVL